VGGVLTERSGRIREARKLTRRRGREKAGLFLAEGPQAVRESVTGFDGRPGSALELFVTADAGDRHADVVARAVAADVPVHEAEDAAVASLSETVTPQGIVAVCRSIAVPGASTAVPHDARLVAVLVEGRDPGNAGTVIRCADAAGADAVLLTAGSVDPEGGKAVRASAGSVFHLPIGVGSPAAEVIAVLRARGFMVLAADGSADVDLDHAEDLLARPTAWLFGNEAQGLSAEVRALADHVVAVPIHGRAESLNLATAAAVCLYASARAQRRSTA
jgi:RNA methyltransferase, TrmH family